MLILKELCIGNFMFEYYLSTFEKYLHYINDVHILSTYVCGNMRKETCLSEPSTILSMRDYAERLSAHFNLEIWSDHFGNWMPRLLKAVS